eukprot:scaffold4649_cov55-Phaeocystis_antarctica.AAC.4
MVKDGDVDGVGGGSLEHPRQWLSGRPEEARQPSWGTAKGRTHVDRAARPRPRTHARRGARPVARAPRRTRSPPGRGAAAARRAAPRPSRSRAARARHRSSRSSPFARVLWRGILSEGTVQDSGRGDK